jgi:hypothetical protein
MAGVKAGVDALSKVAQELAERIQGGDEVATAFASLKSLGGESENAKNMLDDFVLNNKDAFKSGNPEQKEEIKKQLGDLQSNYFNAKSKSARANENYNFLSEYSPEGKSANVSISTKGGNGSVRYTDDNTGGYIDLDIGSGGQRATNITGLYVPEEYRRAGVANSLLQAAMKENPSIMGQVSSKKAAINAYRLGRRPIDNPDASLSEVLNEIDFKSSVNMASIQGGDSLAMDFASRMQQVSEGNPNLYRLSPDDLTITESDFKNIDNYKGNPNRPISAVQTDGKLNILDGHHRAKVAKRDGTDINAVFIPESEYLKMKDEGIHPAEMQKEYVARGMPSRNEAIKRQGLAMDFASRMQRAKEQGEPFKTKYMHNTEKNPFKKSQGQFAMDVEPAGQYFTPLESSPTWDLGENFISGEKSFNNPLVVDFGDGYEGATNWKRRLYEKYGGKKGKALTNAIRKDGYDSIFTVDGSGELSEAVDLYKGKGGVNMASAGAGIGALGLMGASDDSEAGVGKLAMDTASRLKRAKEQGFDTDTTYYHGTPSFKGDGFSSKEIGSNYGYDEQGFFFSNDPRITNDYATSNTLGETITGGQSIPVYASAKNPLVIDKEKARELGVMNPEDEGIVSYWDNQHPWILDEMSDGGHDAIKIIDRDPDVSVNGKPQEMLVMMNPSNIRSTNAAFDPAKKDSSNLLASAGAGIGALGLMGASDDSEASNLNLSQLLAMEGRPLNTDLIQGASTKGILGALSPIADAIEFADENISGPASMMIPTGTSEYIRKLQYGDDIGYLDRLFANPLL